MKLEQVNSRVFLSKVGWLHYRDSRSLLGKMRNVTVSQLGGKWLVSIQTQHRFEHPLPTATTSNGIDVGITRFVTMSDERFIAPLNNFKKH